MPETTIGASGAGAPAEDVNRPPSRAHRRRWRRGGAAVLIAATVAAGAAAYGAYGYAPPEPGRSYHSAYLASVRGYYADTAVARFFYLHEGTGPPVVLISPGDSPAYAWHNQLSALAAAGHSVYVVDLPGQGRTVLHDSSFGWDLPAMTGALASFLDAVHLQRTALVGNSWSGGGTRFGFLGGIRMPGVTLLHPLLHLIGPAAVRLDRLQADVRQHPDHQ